MKISALRLALALLAILLFTIEATAAGNISVTDEYAWSETSGWVNFNSTHGGVTVHTAWLEGYAWSENIGWIKLGSDAGGPYANTNETNWGVNRNGAALSGLAWSEAAGWINFGPADAGVTADPASGEFDGYAWGENIGWIHFRNATAEYGIVYIKADQIILVTISAPAGASYNSSFGVEAAASSGLDVAITTSGSCTGSGSNSAFITITSGTGTCIVHYNQAGDADYNPASEVTGAANAQKATATVSLGNLSQTYDGSFRSAVATTNPPGLTVIITYGSSATTPINAGNYAVAGTIDDPDYEGSGSGTLVVDKAAPVISWSIPTDIIYGTALSGGQLNATAAVPGSFNYSPDSGTVLNAGSGQSLHTVFLPLDSVNYNSASKDVKINVLKAEQTISVTSYAPGTAVYDTSFTVTATATSGLGVKISTSGVCSGNGTGSAVITMTGGTGVCTVHYNQAGNSNFNSASEKTETTTAVYPTHVAIPAAAGSGDITLETNSPGCGFFNYGTRTEAQTGNDPSYEYPYGLVAFSLNCSNADVKITFPGSISRSSYRKYGPTTPGNPSTTSWYNFTNITIDGSSSLTRRHGS